MNTRVVNYLKAASVAASEGNIPEAETYERLARDMADRLDTQPNFEHAEIAFSTGERIYAEAEELRKADEDGLARAKFSEAEKAYQQSLTILRQVGPDARRAYDVIHRLGLCARELGDAQEAIRRFNEALALSDRVFGENSYSALPTRVTLAHAFMRQGQLNEAEAALMAAKTICENAGPAGSRGLALVNESLAAIHKTTGKSALAQQDRENAKNALTEPERRRAAQERTVNNPELAQELEVLDGPEERENIEDILKEMDEKLIGLDDIKSLIKKKADFLKVMAARQKHGLKSKRRSFHLLLVGPSGTGKTTVAGYIGRICYALGLLDTPRVVVVTRGKVVRGVIGGTAIRANEVADFALDGVLFIDEAYLFAPPENDKDFGPEAIGEWMVRMVGDADRLVVVAAGYAREMKVFLESNTGFKSRFTDQWEFDHYNADELYRIFLDVICPENDYELTKGAKTKLRNTCKELVANADEYFGNGRTMHTVFTDTIEEQAARLVAGGLLDDPNALRTIETSDIVVRANATSPKAMA